MRAKEFVKEKYPKANAERHVKGSGEVYWLIRNNRETMYLGHGKSESNAWVHAKKLILNKIL